jgi:NADP-reducing hydrogenase subunit HndB
MADKKKRSLKNKPAKKRSIVKKAASKKRPAQKLTAKKTVAKRPAANKAAAKTQEPQRLSIQDLARIRDATRATLTIREGQGRAKVTVHMGTCGIAAGAREVMDALLEEMRKRNVKDVIVTTSGCVGLCSKEPMATVELKGKPPVKYIELNPQKMRTILVEHVLGGKLVAQYALAVGSETLY